MYGVFASTMNEYYILTGFDLPTLIKVFLDKASVVTPRARNARLRPANNRRLPKKTFHTMLVTLPHILHNINVFV